MVIERKKEENAGYPPRKG